MARLSENTIEKRVKDYLERNPECESELEKSGTWNVYGADPNCDFGGTHHNPFLGKFKGKYSDVLRHAVTLRDWSSWGAGGSIELARTSTPKKIGNITQLLGADIERGYL